MRPQVKTEATGHFYTEISCFAIGFDSFKSYFVHKNLKSFYLELKCGSNPSFQPPSLPTEVLFSILDVNIMIVLWLELDSEIKFDSFSPYLVLSEFKRENFLNILFLFLSSFNKCHQTIVSLKFKSCSLRGWGQAISWDLSAESLNTGVSNTFYRVIPTSSWKLYTETPEKSNPVLLNPLAVQFLLPLIVCWWFMEMSSPSYIKKKWLIYCT